MNAEQIFHQAVEISDPRERAAYLGQVCGNDQQLRREVEALLRADDRAGGFLEGPPVAANVTLDSLPRIDGPGTTIGRYELLELIGEGGMGLVYLAEQKEPVRRKVALKIIKPGMDSRQVIARFEAERQALALLDHPNIAHVFDAGGTETGRPYFVMELVKGMPITRYCDENTLTIEQRLRLFEQVCEAIQHAHQKGIIHRDLKPSNILVSIQGDRPVPKIIDFGIAKAITSPLTDKTFVTLQGQLLGTPEYMSPEQVDLATQDIDTRSDIYSLGVVLYELLAGVLPFEEESFARAGLAEIQRTIREDEPTSPSIRLTRLGEQAKTIAASRGTQAVPLARRLHRELEWIPLKAMRKDRCRRYRSASEMADDVRNYLNGLPLLAGPETTTYRVQKFVRKHAGSVATVALVAGAIVLGLIVSIAMYLRAEDARQKESQARAQETTARVQAQEAQKVAQEQRSLAEQAEQATQAKAEELRRTLYVNSIQLADAKHRQGDAKAVRVLLASCPNDLRGWEWNHLNYISDQARMTLKGASDEVIHPVFSPDGRLIASGGWGKSIKIWDATSGSELMNLTGHEDTVWCVAFSPDGQRLASASADKTVRVWDVQSGREVRTLRGHGKEVCYVTFSPDGKRIASAERGPATKIWDAATGAEVTNIQRRSSWMMGLAFSPDGERITSGNKDSITVWDTTSAAQIMTIAAAHKLWVTCVAYSPDGKSIVSCGWDSSIKVWDASTGKETIVLHSRSQRLNYVSYDSSGKFVVAQDQGNTISVWDTATGGVVVTLAGHEANIRSVSFSRDGRRILSGSEDRTICVWDTSWSREQLVIPTQLFDLGLSYSPDSKRFATGDPRGSVRIWDAAAGTDLMALPAGGSQVCEVAFSPDGKRLASGTPDGIVRIWDAATGAQVLSLPERKGYRKAVVAIAFSPEGRNIAFGGDEEVIRVHDTRTGAELRRLSGHKGQVGSLTYNPDGTRIISGCWDGTARVWDAATGTEVLAIRADGDTLCGHVALSHDGRRIAGGTEQGSIIIWDAGTGMKVNAWSAHTSLAQGVSFSPDDKRLASVSREDSTVKVWDTGTGTELITLVPLRDVTRVTFSPDGRTIAARCAGGVILWETAEPPGGYGLRETGQTGRRLVDTLHQKHGSYHDTINELQGNRTLEGPVRKLALEIANCRLWEDARKLVDELYEKRGSYHDIVEELKADEALNEPVRILASQIAGYDLWADARKLFEESRNALGLSSSDPNAARVALEKAEQANRLEPNNVEILSVLGSAQTRIGAYRDALATCTKADSLKPNDVGVLTKLALVQYHMGDYDDALKTLTKANSLEPNQPFVLNELGMVHYRRGAYEDAIRTITKANEILTTAGRNQPSPMVAFMAMSLYRLGRMDEAKTALEQLHRLRKDERYAKNEEIRALLAEVEGLIEDKKP